MTIEIRIVTTPDVSVANEVVNLSYAQGHKGGALSATSFLYAGPSGRYLVDVLSFIFNLVSKKAPENDIWIFVGNSSRQPDTRIVRYRKLWGALKSRGLEILGGSNAKEITVDVDGGVKFFAALLLSEQSIESVVKVLLGERCSYILVLPKDVDAQAALEKGWSGDMSEDLSFYYYICGIRGLVFKRIGEFDDCEWGFLAIGSPDSMRALLD